MKKIVLFLMSCSFVVFAYAQSNTVTTGGTASGDGGTVTYTVGQIAVQTNGGGAISVAEGVQQPYEISVVGIDDFPAVTLKAKVYPNPTLGEVTLAFEGGLELMSQNGISMNTLQYRMNDANGKTLSVNHITSDQSQIDLTACAPGTYYITVFSDKNVLKTFKVVKTGR